MFYCWFADLEVDTPNKETQCIRNNTNKWFDNPMLHVWNRAYFDRLGYEIDKHYGGI